MESRKTTSTFSGEGLKWAVSDAEQFSNRENSGFQYSCWVIYENGKQVEVTRENSKCKLEKIRDSDIQRYDKQVRGGTEEPMRADTKSRSEEIQKGRYTRIRKAGKSRYEEADTIEQGEKKRRVYTKSTYATTQNVEKRGYKEQVREDTKNRYEGIQRMVWRTDERCKEKVENKSVQRKFGRRDKSGYEDKRRRYNQTRYEEEAAHP